MARKQTSENKVAVSSSAAAAPARREGAAPKRAPRTAVKSATSAPKPTIAAAKPVIAPTFEEISRLAHSYWVARGCQGGSPEEDWVRAERELLGN